MAIGGTAFVPAVITETPRTASPADLPFLRDTLSARIPGSLAVPWGLLSWDTGEREDSHVPPVGAEPAALAS